MPHSFEKPAIAAALREAAKAGSLSWEAELRLGRALSLTPRDIEGAALEVGLRLERYERNYRTIDAEGQLRLHRSRVLVAGAGGLGGYLVEELARIGVGTMLVVDPDSFDASNLNRQLLSSLSELGRPKVEAARARVGAINPAVLVEAQVLRLDAANAEALLVGATGAGAVDCAADALDSIPDRLMLEKACAATKVPLVHAAIAGPYIQATTILPGTGSLARLFGKDSPPKGIETELGNPAYTPAIAASIEVSEILRILLGKPPALAGVLFHFDLERMESVRLPLG
jgi:molybdopterin/thiamine biosynthesis adenylyltransferase